MKKYLIIFIVAILVVGGGSFYAGMKVGDNKKLGVFGQNNLSGQRQQFIGGMQGSQNGMSFVAGSIISKDDKSITVKLQNGGSKVVFYTNSTEIGKFTTGNLSDLEVGKSISITGKTNQDGSVSAQSIQIKPTGQTGMPGGNLPAQQ